MAHIAICSCVRNGISYLSVYRRQLESLLTCKADSWHLYILEGDSSDGSFEFLQQWAKEDARITVGQMHVGEATNKNDRAKRWAMAANACIDLIPADSSHTHILWIEADLYFPPDLVDRLLILDVDAVAPIIFLGSRFYDSWGFRDLSGHKWTDKTLYSKELQPLSLVEMSSVGSCILFKRAIWDSGIRFRGTYEDGLLVGICTDARKAGFRIWADTSSAILHPVPIWEAQMWRPSEIYVKLDNDRRNHMSASTARELSIAARIPLIDPEKFLGYNQWFVCNLFKYYDTNRIELNIIPERSDSREYELEISPHPPTRIASVRAVRLLLFWLFKRKPFDFGRPNIGRSLRRQLIRRFFSVRISITSKF